MTDSTFDDLEKGNVVYNDRIDDPIMNKNTITQSKTICTLSDDGETVFLGGMAIDRRDLAKIFPEQASTIVKVEQTNWRPVGNPIPLGLIGYCISTFTLSLTLMEARGATNPKLLISSALMFSGLVTMICGFWCLLLDNTFACTALAAFGGFYLSYAVILIDAFDIVSSYATVEEFNNVMGFWLAGWTIYATIMWILTWKGTVEFFLLIGNIVLYLLTLTIYYFTLSEPLKKASGVFAFLSVICGFYCIWALQCIDATSHVIPPTLLMPGTNRKAKRL